jgi:hypothetical protein
MVVSVFKLPTHWVNQYITMMFPDITPCFCYIIVCGLLLFIIEHRIDLKYYLRTGADVGFWSGGSVIGFSSLSGLNLLTNRVLNKNIKIISFIY